MVLDQSVPIVVTLRVAGDSLEIDLTGSAPQTLGPVNSVRSGMLAAAFFVARSLAADTPANAGSLAPIRLILPERSVVNAQSPAAVNARTATVKLAVNTMLAALALASPANRPAANSGVALVLSLGGRHVDGKSFVVTEIIAGGSGAHPDGAGVAGVATDVGNGKNLSAEVLETVAPVRVHQVAIRRGSGGSGRNAGGEGVIREYRVLDGPIEVSHRGERHRSHASGSAGGGAGASSLTTVVRADGRHQVIDSKARVILQRGDRITMQTAGGGGWGSDHST